MRTRVYFSLLAFGCGDDGTLGEASTRNAHRTWVGLAPPPIRRPAPSLSIMPRGRVVRKPLQEDDNAYNNRASNNRVRAYRRVVRGRARPGGRDRRGGDR